MRSFRQGVSRQFTLLSRMVLCLWISFPISADVDSKRYSAPATGMGLLAKAPPPAVGTIE
jgi:hypothetical protein